MDDDREKQLAFLQRHAVNMRPPQPRRAPGASQPLVKAVIQGIGPVIAEQLNALKAENAELKAANETLRAEHRAELAELRGRCAQIEAGISESRLAVVEMQQRTVDRILEEFGQPPRYGATASPRRLS